MTKVFKSRTIILMCLEGVLTIKTVVLLNKSIIKKYQHCIMFDGLTLIIPLAMSKKKDLQLRLFLSHFYLNSKILNSPMINDLKSINPKHTRISNWCKWKVAY